MVKCGLDDEYGACTSCKTCKADLLKTIDKLEKDLEMDKRQGIKHYPIRLVEYILRAIKGVLEND